MNKFETVLYNNGLNGWRLLFPPESHSYFDVYNCKMMINLLFGVGRNYVIVQKGGVYCLPLAISCWSHYSIVDCAVSYVNTTTTHRRSLLYDPSGPKLLKTQHQPFQSPMRRTTRNVMPIGYCLQMCLSTWLN